MRNWTTLGAILLTMILAGCATTNLPTDGSTDSWSQFGYEEGQKGFVKKDQEWLDLTKDSLFSAYSEGYEKGRQEYCSQDAYQLGIMGKPYAGVCDELDWRFRLRYNDGRSSQSMGRL